MGILKNAPKIGAALGIAAAVLSIASNLGQRGSSVAGIQRSIEEDVRDFSSYKTRFTICGVITNNAIIPIN